MPADPAERLQMASTAERDLSHEGIVNGVLIRNEADIIRIGYGGDNVFETKSLSEATAFMDSNFGSVMIGGEARGGDIWIYGGATARLNHRELSVSLTGMESVRTVIVHEFGHVVYKLPDQGGAAQIWALSRLGYLKP
jgi:hypothetical protein